MNVLVTGGAGYIGSHAVRKLLQQGHTVVAVDHLGRGHHAAVDPRAEFFVANIADTPRLADLMRIRRIEAVLHFAALAYVGESVEQPLLYYANNTAGTLGLLTAMQQAGVQRLVFSSTCATYGVPDQIPIVEDSPQRPINPYGWSKLFVEQILQDYLASNPGFAFTALRYFNVAGCDPDGRLGEDHHPETHLIPVLLQTALGRRASVRVFGTDYPTPDGTCIRDYIHVDDLCAAHVRALERLQSGQGRFYNLGIGRGYSVREVIEAVRRVSGRDFPIEYVDRRPGDPPVLFANAAKIRRELSWLPRFTEIEPIVETAWRWFRDHPHGYADAQRPAQ